MASDLFISVHLKNYREYHCYIYYQTEWNFNHSVLLFFKIIFYLLVLVLYIVHFFLFIVVLCVDSLFLQSMFMSCFYHWVLIKSGHWGKVTLGALSKWFGSEQLISVLIPEVLLVPDLRLWFKAWSYLSTVVRDVWKFPGTFFCS